MKYCILFFVFFLLLLSGSGYSQIREIVTIAGSNSTGNFGGDGGPADSALLHGPRGVAIDNYGNVYIQDFYNFRVRKVNALGYISTFAGNGNTTGFAGDNSLAPSAVINPNSVATDKHGNVYISDNSQGVVRKVNFATNIITLFAGRYGFMGYAGDSGLAVNAKLSDPRGMCFDKKGNMYIADVGNHVIRKVDSFGKIYTFAGNTFPFYGGDGGFAINASIDSPMAVAADKWNNIYIADYKNNLVRKVDTNGIITTVAGNLFASYAGDGGLAISASLNSPRGVAVDKYGFLYIADASNHVIRMVDTFGIITTVAGNGTPGFSGDHGVAFGANLFFPQAVAVDTFRSLYIADADNQRVRKVYMPTVGTKIISSLANLNVYPNPCTTEINIAGLKPQDKVAVYNIIGYQVSNTWQVVSETVQTLPIDNLSNGIYFIQVWDANGNKKAVIRIEKE